VLFIAIFVRVIFSWIGMDSTNPIFGVVHDITEPILAPIRQFMPRNSMIDLSPMVAGFLLILIAQAASRVLV
jgi:YggT family protein